MLDDIVTGYHSKAGNLLELYASVSEPTVSGVVVPNIWQALSWGIPPLVDLCHDLVFPGIIDPPGPFVAHYFYEVL